MMEGPAICAAAVAGRCRGLRGSHALCRSAPAPGRWRGLRLRVVRESPEEHPATATGRTCDSRALHAAGSPPAPKKRSRCCGAIGGIGPVELNGRRRTWRFASRCSAEFFMRRYTAVLQRRPNPAIQVLTGSEVVDPALPAGPRMGALLSIRIQLLSRLEEQPRPVDVVPGHPRLSGASRARGI